MSQWIRTERRHAIYRRDDYRCAYCGHRFKSQLSRLTLDHVQPRAKGGSNRNSNLVTCCDDCNLAKGKKTLNQFLDWVRVNKPMRSVYFMRQRVQRWRRRVVKYA
jgi:5-methylcytosine-specific restriction endonuclease McrA